MITQFIKSHFGDLLTFAKWVGSLPSSYSLSYSSVGQQELRPQSAVYRLQKMPNTFFFSFFILLCCLTSSSLFATNPSENYIQEDLNEHTFDEAKWKEIISEIDYSKDLKPEKKKEKKEEDEDENEAWNWQSPIQFGEGFGKALSIALLSILGIVGLVLLLRFLLVPPKNRKIESEKELAISVEEIADNLESHDPRSLLEKAIDAENYRLAVRLYYLKTIRELSLKKQIQWQRDKTNHSYLQEMNGHALQNDFRELTLFFERVWYGNREIRKTDFEMIRPKAETLLKAVDSIA